MVTITILMVITQSVNVTNVTIVSNYVRVVPFEKTPGYDYNTAYGTDNGVT